MAVVTRVVDLVRTLRGQNGPQGPPAARPDVARAAGAELVERDALLELAADEVNVKSIELIGDESELVDRRVKPLLPKIGKKLGSAIPAVMAAAREGRFEILPDGSVSARRRDARPRRGGDPGHSAARHRRGPRRGPRGGHRHGADAGAARRRRRPRAAAGHPGRPQGRRRGARRRGPDPRRCARRRQRQRSSPSWPPSRPRRAAGSSSASAPAHAQSDRSRRRDDPGRLDARAPSALRLTGTSWRLRT